MTPPTFDYRGVQCLLPDLKRADLGPGAFFWAQISTARARRAHLRARKPECAPLIYAQIEAKRGKIWPVQRQKSTEITFGSPKPNQNDQIVTAESENHRHMTWKMGKEISTAINIAHPWR